MTDSFCTHCNDQHDEDEWAAHPPADRKLLEIDRDQLEAALNYRPSWQITQRKLAGDPYAVAVAAMMQDRGWQLAAVCDGYATVIDRLRAAGEHRAVENTLRRVAPFQDEMNKITALWRSGQRTPR